MDRPYLHRPFHRPLRRPSRRCLAALGACAVWIGLVTLAPVDSLPCPAAPPPRPGSLAAVSCTLLGRLVPPAHAEGAGEVPPLLRAGVAAGGRAAGLGGAYAALAHDPLGPLWNAAGLAEVDRPALSLARSSFVEDVSLDALAYAQPGRRGTWAGGLLRLSSTGIPEADPAGPTGGTFDYEELLVYVSRGWPLGHGWWAGWTLKGLRQTLAGEQGTGAGFDVGVLYTGRDGWRLAVALHNILHLPIHWTTGTRHPLPPTGRVGLAYRLPGLPVAVATDFTSDGRLHGGAEWQAGRSAALRLGLEGQLAGAGAADRDLDWSVALGAGLRAAGAVLDYAFVLHSSLGGQHRISLGVRF